MNATGREGVIKFALDYQPGPLPDVTDLAALNAWRTIFRQLGLLGQDPSRYAGYGFGNLSRRLSGNHFLISGTQTGGLQHLHAGHYVVVQQCDPVANRVVARGPIKPSSESLSHGALYLAEPSIDWVMHLHSPEIFGQAARLQLPCTNPAAAYGTPAMAAELARLANSLDTTRPQLLVMSGHEDGILAFGSSAAQVGGLVVATLADALAGMWSQN